MNPQNPQDPYAPQSPQQPAAGTEEYHPKTIYSEPQGVAPALPIQPQVAAPVFGATPVGVEAASAVKKSSKKVPIIVGSVVSVVVLLLIIVGIVAGTANKTAKKTSTSKKQPAIMQPATDIELEQINTSNTQDMTSLDDEKDYPATSLDNKSIGL